MGDVVHVRGTVSTYQNRLQVRVEQVLPLNETDYSLDDLINKPDDVDAIHKQFHQYWNLSRINSAVR